MIAGLSGSLLSHEALERTLADRLRGHLDEAGRHRARARLRDWHLPLRAQLGPATSARTCFDRLAAPLFSQLGYHVVPCATSDQLFSALLEADGRPVAGLVVTPWGQTVSRAWRHAVHLGIAHGLTWCFCLVGPSLRLIDSRRTYSRRYVEFSLESALDDERAFEVFWGLMRAAAMRSDVANQHVLLERAVEISEEHRSTVRSSLQNGVHESIVHLLRAFGRATPRGDQRRIDGTSGICAQRAFDESLTIVYRLLFLLFAEARGLVPRWHPVFRDAYTIESLRRSVELLPRPRGLWETLQAIARLAHRGCRIGTLRVPPFNGRLFSPVDAPLSDILPLDDSDVRQALLALTTRPGKSGRVTITYGDLGVEQLGSVYERVLDFQAAPITAPSTKRPFLVPAEQRKMTGSFYTPRSVTDYLVRRTLAPLVRDASPERILALRVLDPAMGSGAFLVAACRFLADAYESALIRQGTVTCEDITDTERVQFRRAIAQQCLYGVDINPMAVQVGRLSIWLATLAADRPLTFLDHRLRIGNSLAGASVSDACRRPSLRPVRARRRTVLPLFDDAATDGVIRDAVLVRGAIAATPGDTLDQVRSKERALAEVNGAGIAKWKELADLWCCIWFTDDRTRRTLTDAFATLTDVLLDRHATLPSSMSAALLETARSIARDVRFFHWRLEFPEVFHDVDGHPRDSLGFDAVIGNPPWEMLRGDRGNDEARSSAHSSGSRLTTFARSSGVYRYQGDGHANLYQLFLERAVTLLRDAGRLGLVLPSGFAVDCGSATLRRAVFDRVSIDALISIENRDGVFPIHRGLKFLLLSGTKSGPTAALPCRFGIRRPESLDALPDSGDAHGTVMLSRSLLERMSGAGLAVPEIRTTLDLEIVTAISFGVPALGDPEGWNVQFGRELNATEDRRHFIPAGPHGLRVIEGKQLRPFAVDLGAVRYCISRRRASAIVDPDRTFRRVRLAYRDVAAAGNRLSLIATVVPEGLITTHTVFCLKNDLDADTQQYLCGIFNSFVANYLVRLRITMHVSASVIERLPVPKLHTSDPRFKEMVALARALASKPDDAPGRARIQGLAARLYRVTRDQYEHILATFPLVAAEERAAALSTFRDIFG